MIKKNKIKTAYIALGLFFLFAFSFGAFFIFSDLKVISFFSPEKVLEKSLLKMEEIEKGRTKIILSANTKEKEELLFVLDTVFDKTKEESDFILSFEDIFLITGKIKKLEDSVYFNFSKIDLSSSLELMMLSSGINIQEFVDIWIKVPQKDSNLQNREKIREIIYQSDYYFIKEEIKEKKEVYHYTLSFNDDETIVKLLDLIVDFENEEFLSEKETIIQIIESIKEISLRLAGEIELEFFINKEDYFLYLVRANKEIDKKVFGQDILFSLEINNYKIDELVEIELQEEYFNLSDLIEGKK
ncbi:MAG: hypothetical protein PHV26_02485 [Candidatus Pacebacteria bacterium]|jgi:hypothetical protein|nr:hypothetical protein [Candidatus Paceibacterota bacterium]